jgi:uncharacterized protein YqgV (UPF0045/DUF77 family)
MAEMVMGIQVMPQTDKTYDVVDAAIAAIAATGLPHQVTPLETVVVGELDQLMDAAKAAHRACLAAGARSVITHIKLAEAAGDVDVTPESILVRYQ